MKHSAQLHRCLEDGDAAGAAALWNECFPGFPAPTDPEASLHMARTIMASMPLRLRAYSHRWLCDRGLPSQLPDELRPRAERMYPVFAKTVGISVNFGSKSLAPLAAAVRGSMENAVLESFADGKTDPAFVRSRMQVARETTIKKLLG